MISSNSSLSSLDKTVRILIVLYLLTLSLGVTLGLSYVYLTTNMTPAGMSEQYLGNDNDWNPKLPKTIIDLISHTHDHVIVFSIIFFSIGLLFSLNSKISNFWKMFLIFEPFLSIIVTFGGFFVIRFINSEFSYIVIFSSMLMYACFYIMVSVILYELIFCYDN